MKKNQLMTVGGVMRRLYQRTKYRHGLPPLEEFEVLPTHSLEAAAGARWGHSAGFPRPDRAASDYLQQAAEWATWNWSHCQTDIELELRWETARAGLRLTEAESDAALAACPLYRHLYGKDDAAPLG
jgi:hypothetical protein